MNYRKLDDADLVLALVKDNDEDAFCELYIRYRKKLFLFCMTFVKVSDLAEDIVHDVFVIIWTKRKFIDSSMSFSAYIYTITRNRVLNFLREANKDVKIKNQLCKSLILSSDIINDDYTSKEYAEIIEDAINQLSPMRQNIFRLSRENKMTHKEIAKYLNISIYTVQENISASLKQIKIFLRRFTDFDF